MTDIGLDTEFLDDGAAIGLISVGLAREDGRTYYAVNGDADWYRIARHDWLCGNVVPHLPVLPLAPPAGADSP